jgi:Ribbon-helix-helix protein, copG family
VACKTDRAYRQANGLWNQWIIERLGKTRRLICTNEIRLFIQSYHGKTTFNREGSKGMMLYHINFFISYNIINFDVISTSGGDVMAFVGVKMTNDEKQKLEKMAERSGMTVSDLVRDMIRNDHQRQTISEALDQLKSVAGTISSQRAVNGNNEDISEIRRIVTLIARAMPSVAKHI